MAGLREDRWQHLVTGAFALDERRKSSGAKGGAKDAVAFLESVLEVFPASVDPVDDFEGYAVRRAALSLLAALEADSPPARKKR